MRPTLLIPIAVSVCQGLSPFLLRFTIPSSNFEPSIPLGTIGITVVFAAVSVFEARNNFIRSLLQPRQSVIIDPNQVPTQVRDDRLLIELRVTPGLLSIFGSSVKVNVWALRTYRSIKL